MQIDRALRSDMSLALIHLTGPRSGLQPIDSLISLLQERRIRATGKSGFIKGDLQAVCFTEMPLSAIPLLVKKSSTSKHPYGFYGIALHKTNGFSQGARPVIYLPVSETSWIPQEEKWRHVRFEIGTVDFCHEREWRSCGDFLLNGDFGFYVIVESSACEARIRESVSSNALTPVLGFIHMTTLIDFL
ncbi:MAG: hypothetical protein ACRERU_21340 [Methylococcales bacterium]